MAGRLYVQREAVGLKSRGYNENSVLSALFCCEPTTALQNKVYFKNFKKKKVKNIIYSINSQMLIIHIRNDESQNSVHNKLYNQLKNCCPCKHFLFFHSLFLPRPRAESQNHSYHAQK